MSVGEGAGLSADKAPGLSADKAPGLSADKAPGLSADKAPGLSADKAPGLSADKAPVGVLWVDFGGVLTPPVREAADRVVAASGVPWSELAAAAEGVADELGLRGFAPLELGLLTQREWAARLTARLTTAPRIDLGRWDEYWYADRPIDRALVAELERIAGRGVRVGLLTNSVAEWEPHRARMLDGVDVFTAAVRSHEIGLAKPDPAIFRHADGVLAPPAGTRAVLVDDQADNCAGAVRHGWGAVRHGMGAETVGWLRRLVP